MLLDRVPDVFDRLAHFAPRVTDRVLRLARGLVNRPLVDQILIVRQAEA